jgi:hypothetical protein
MKREKNPAFTFYADDALSWEPINFLSDQLLGQAFRLIVYACKNGGSLALGHPLLGLLDPKVIELCTRTVDDRIEVIAPHDLPKLMAKRRAWAASRKAGADAAGRDAGGKFKGRS